jgi:hypothetical protein
MQTAFLQTEESGCDLICSLSVAAHDRTIVLLTSLMASALVAYLNWNSTMCVVYGMNGAWLPKIAVIPCPRVREKRNRPDMQKSINTAPKSFLGTSILTVESEVQCCSKNRVHSSASTQVQRKRCSISSHAVPHDSPECREACSSRSLAAGLGASPHVLLAVIYWPKLSKLLPMRVTCLIAEIRNFKHAKLATRSRKPGHHGARHTV